MNGARGAPGPFDGYVFDLDGTVYLDDELLPDARETIAALRARGAAIVFATNKPLESTEQYVAKLTRLGIPAAPADIVTAIDSLVRYLDARHPAARLMIIGEDVLARRLSDEGYTLVAAPADTDVVVVSFDRGFDYGKLHAAYRAVRESAAAIVATNPDPTCPTRDGGLPDCAAMLAALEACTGARAEAVLGKPSRWMAETCLARLGVGAERAAVVGDRLLTDVAMGQRLGAAGVLVLSGATREAEIAGSGVTPDFVLSGIGELLPRDREDGPPMIEFIFMLTHEDATVPNAREVLAELEGSALRYIGFKDVGASPEVLAEVTTAAHAASMQVMLEVVSTSVEDELRSLRAAREIGVDWVLGGTHAEQGAQILDGSGLRYCPFPGTVEGHPSVLSGEIDAIAADAARLTGLDVVCGVDLLAYRHRDVDPVTLTRAVVAAADGPVIAAGSVSTTAQIADLEDAGAWGFTIGSAIFDARLPGGPSVAGQVQAVLAAASRVGR